DNVSRSGRGAPNRDGGAGLEIGAGEGECSTTSGGATRGGESAQRRRGGGCIVGKGVGQGSALAIGIGEVGRGACREGEGGRGGAVTGVETCARPIEIMLAAVAVVPPIVTVAPAWKLVPVRVTSVPPAVGPLVGLTALSVGGGAGAL